MEVSKGAIGNIMLATWLPLISNMLKMQRDRVRIMVHSSNRVCLEVIDPLEAIQTISCHLIESLTSQLWMDKAIKKIIILQEVQDQIETY
jgi:hypothetical protein